MKRDPNERRTIDVDGVYDIETENWTRFVAGGLLTHGEYLARTWEREDDFVDCLLETKGRIWAHNGGRYDALWFLGHVRRRGLKAVCNGQGQRITNLKVGDLILCDSYALIPMALEKAALLGRYKKSETGLPCQCGSDCGGYCSISRTMSRSLLSRLLSYLENDCRATLSMLDSLSDYAEANDIDLSYTIGGSSWKTASRTLGLSAASWSWGSRGQSAFTLYGFARSAYFGGRTQVFRPSAPSGWRYDVNSAYPAALAKLALPTGIAREVYNERSRKAYRDGKEGLFRARVRVPECHIPPLPTRTRLRLAYPVGRIDGVWAGNELRYAETQGCIVERIDACLFWHDSEVVFGPLCRRIWDLRDKAGPKTAWGTWLKWFANSLTGRLAIRPENETIIVGDPTKFRFCPADFDCRNGLLHGSSRRRCCAHACTRRCGATMPLGPGGQFSGVFVRPRWQIADSAHVHYAAYLTAHARIELHRQLTDYGNDDGWSAVYCDTDSCYSITERVENLGPQLGQFKEEGAFRDFTALAPKTYSYRDTDTGEFEARSKGIENPVRNWARIALGEGIRMTRGVKGLRSAMRDDDETFVRKDITRALHSNVDQNGVAWYGDRWLGPDGCTHPTDTQNMRG
jgi:DNA polymerase type B, organellar and viral